MCELSPVSFHGDTIYCVTIENQPFTPAKPIVENMGLAWQTQARKLTDNKERWGITIMMIPSESGEQQTLCIPVRKLPAFLASINPRKVKIALREKIELYQREYDDALWDYWTKGHAERSSIPSTSSTAPLTPDQQCTLQALVKAKVEAIPEAERHGGMYPQIWSRFNNHFRIARYAQLPQCRLSEAIAYLTQMELSPSVQPRRAITASQAGMQAKKMRIPHDADKTLKLLHETRERLRWDLIPSGYTLGDSMAAERFDLAEDLYVLQDCLWAALWRIVSATRRVGDWDAARRSQARR